MTLMWNWQTIWLAKQKKRNNTKLSLHLRTEGQIKEKKKKKKRRKQKLPDSKKLTTEFFLFLPRWHTCAFKRHSPTSKTLANFFFQQNIHKEKPFLWQRKTLKYFVLRSHKRKKNLLASKTIFSKRDIIFSLPDIAAPICNDSFIQQVVKYRGYSNILPLPKY